MNELYGVLTEIVNNVLFGITIIIFTTYLTLMVYSAIALRSYLRKNSYVNYNTIVTSPLVPSISVIVPAYNESLSIIDNIRTLLSLYYNDFEIVVVNDGSTDDTMEKIVKAYELEKVNYYFDYQLPCERVKGVYKSRNRSYKKLIVVDKRNGGKSDALNAGLNVVRNDLFVSIDADSILEQDALMRLVKPFLEEREKKVIGAGGVIRIANSCEISGGKIKKINLPRRWLPRAQVIEYTRAFLIGRIAWSELDGLLLISGALAMFDREVVIKSGGYSTETVGEDMELVVRIRMYMAEQGIPYQVEYIPDPLCWTEVPATIRSLAMQRSRWTRGTIETIVKHRKLFLNRRFGKLGLLGYPYWLFFEWLAPILEFIGIIIFATLAILGRLNVSFFLLLLGFVYFFAVSLSIWAVLFEEVTFHKYEKKRDVLRLMLTAFLEPILYHPLVLIMTIKGNIDKLLKKSTWGKQEREGFKRMAEENRSGRSNKGKSRSGSIFIGIAGVAIIALVVLWVVKMGEPDIHVQKEPAPLIVNEDPGPVPHTLISDKSYHIIIGSFESKENAEKLVEQLQSVGHQSAIIPSGDSISRVAMSSFSDRQEAIDSLNQIRIRPGMKHSWILVLPEPHRR